MLELPGTFFCQLLVVGNFFILFSLTPALFNRFIICLFLFRWVLFILLFGTIQSSSLLYFEIWLQKQKTSSTKIYFLQHWQKNVNMSFKNFLSTFFSYHHFSWEGGTIYSNGFFYSVYFGRSIYSSYRVVSVIIRKHLHPKIWNSQIFFRFFFFTGSYQVLKFYLYLVVFCFFHMFPNFWLKIGSFLLIKLKLCKNF